jgi:hypothetical protein
MYIRMCAYVRICECICMLVVAYHRIQRSNPAALRNPRQTHGLPDGCYSGITKVLQGYYKVEIALLFGTHYYLLFSMEVFRIIIFH